MKHISVRSVVRDDGSEVKKMEVINQSQITNTTSSIVHMNTLVADRKEVLDICAGLFRLQNKILFKNARTRELDGNTVIV